MEALLIEAIKKTLKELYNIEAGNELQLQKTRKEFKGDYTINVFPWIKQIRKAPNITADEIGTFLKQNYSELIESYEVVNGFLNITLFNSYFFDASIIPIVEKGCIRVLRQNKL
ncbi:MAG TPA: hypothetical protein PKG63_06415, partial [Bacteroidales bacterium]|nr:hypothetical protein [Bacteroidales bacterium]